MLPTHSQTELSGHMSDLYRPRPVMTKYKNKNGATKVSSIYNTFNVLCDISHTILLIHTNLAK